MTVAELIEILSESDPDTPVFADLEYRCLTPWVEDGWYTEEDSYGDGLGAYKQRHYTRPNGEAGRRYKKAVFLN